MSTAGKEDTELKFRTVENKGESAGKLQIPPRVYFIDNNSYHGVGGGVGGGAGDGAGAGGAGGGGLGPGGGGLGAGLGYHGVLG